MPNPGVGVARVAPGARAGTGVNNSFAAVNRNNVYSSGGYGLGLGVGGFGGPGGYGFGGGYGYGGYGRGGYGYGGGYGMPGFRLVFIPGLGWVLVPVRALRWF
jgi:hypothetical protein